MACGACYRGKTKCDGQRPCDRCVKMNRTCGERRRKRAVKPVKPPPPEDPFKTPVKVKANPLPDLSQWAREPVPADDMVHVLRYAEWTDSRVLAAITSESPGYYPLPLPKVS